MHVLLTQDPCRDPFFGLTANGFLYQWLDGLMRVRFEDAGWTVALAAPRDAGGNFDPRPLADALGLTADAPGWARLFDLPPDRHATLDALVDAQLGTPRPDLIVGFELPPWLMGWARRRDIAFVCLAPAGYRFLPELLVELHSTVPGLTDAAAAHAVDRATLESAASLFAAGRRARHQRPLLSEGRIGLLAGQMAIDAANIASGRLTTLDRRIDAIAAIADGLDTLLVCPHPYEPDRVPLDAVCRAIGHARLTSLPAYDLLCAPPVRDVIALSSSLLAEAPLFGKRAHALITNDRTACRAALGLRPVVLPIDALLPLLTAVARGQTAPDTIRAPLAGTGTPFRDGLGLRWGLDATALPALLHPGLRLETVRADTAQARGASPLPMASRPHGWWPPDDAFAWTDAREAALLLRANGAAGHRLDLDLYAPPHADAPVVVGLAAGSTTVQTAIAPGDTATLHLEIPADALIGGTLLELRLTTDRLTPPAAGSADRRTLGIALGAVTLR